MDIDFEKIRQRYKISKRLWFKDFQVVLKEAKVRSFEVKEYLQEEGSQNRTIYFIQKGLIRFFILNERGEEITTWLRWENHLFASFDVVLFEQPSRFYIQALEPTSVLTIDFDRAQELLRQNPYLEEYRRTALRDILKSTLKHTESFLLFSPEERYLNYIQQNPNIVNRVPGKFIANILGITPVSLSRIRKRIAEKGGKR